MNTTAAPAKTLPDMINLMSRLKERLDALDKRRKELQAAYDQVRLRDIPDKMAEDNITSITGDFGRCTLRSEMYTQVLQREELHEFLKANGHGDLIQETVNAMTLKAFVKEQERKPMGEGLDIPESMLKVTPVSMAVIYAK